MNLQDRYNNEIRQELKKALTLSNIMAVPKLEKITVNAGIKEALGDKKVLEVVSQELQIITGQKPVVTKAKKSISTFKLRAGDSIGVMVTLRGKRMYDFMTKLVAITFPRVRDFRGLPKTSFDGKGNYSVGFREQIVFPEIDAGKIDRTRSLQVVITTSAKNDEEGRALLTEMGVPFRK